MKHQVTLKMMLDTRRAKNNGLYPVKLRVTTQRKQKYYPVLNRDKTPLDLSPEDFKKVYGEKPRGDHKQHRDFLDTMQVKVREAIETLPVFSFEFFEHKFFGTVAGKNAADVEQALADTTSQLNEAGRISTAEGYEACKKSLAAFKPGLQFTDITPQLLKDFHSFMEGTGKSRTTVGIYMRYLRAVFNDAIAVGVIDRQYYPFGREKGKYQIPTGQNTKKALPKVEIHQIFTYQPENDDEAKARDFWVFCYLGNGMNVKDMIGLRFRDIDFKSGMISFYRAKTSNRVQVLEKVEAVLLPQARQIIERWGNSQQHPDAFVFPILEEKMDAKKRKLAKDLCVQFMNKHTKRIAAKLGIDTKLTTYVARHSFATVLKRSGASIEFISESLGHKNIKTTANYLASFEDDTKRANAALLIDFEAMPA